MNTHIDLTCHAGDVPLTVMSTPPTMTPWPGTSPITWPIASENFSYPAIRFMCTPTPACFAPPWRPSPTWR
ncbi:hypothetical protein ACFQX6_24255 [Streptosporangium lutulentum]